MNLKSTNKINSTFSMSSMTDIIFLLLIFFMLTASFVTPSGLPVNLPSSKSSTISIQKVSVTITKDLKYFVNDKESDENLLEAHIRDAIGNIPSADSHLLGLFPIQLDIQFLIVFFQLQIKPY